MILLQQIFSHFRILQSKKNWNGVQKSHGELLNSARTRNVCILLLSPHFMISGMYFKLNLKIEYRNDGRFFIFVCVPSASGCCCINQYDSFSESFIDCINDNCATIALTGLIRNKHLPIRQCGKFYQARHQFDWYRANGYVFCSNSHCFASQYCRYSSSSHLLTRQMKEVNKFLSTGNL